MEIPFTVYDLQWNSLGLAETFTDARTLHIDHLERHYPELVTHYVGVCTLRDSFGGMVFVIKPEGASCPIRQLLPINGGLKESRVN